MINDPTQIILGFKFKAAGLEAEVVEVVQAHPEPMVRWRFLIGSTVYKDLLSAFITSKEPIQ